MAGARELLLVRARAVISRNVRIVVVTSSKLELAEQPDRLEPSRTGEVPRGSCGRPRLGTRRHLPRPGRRLRARAAAARHRAAAPFRRRPVRRPPLRGRSARAWAVSFSAYQRSGRRAARREVLLENLVQRRLRKCQRLTELAVYLHCVGHRSSNLDRLVRYLTNLQSSGTCLPMDATATDRPSLALLLRVIHQRHSQAIESALRAAGFNDIAPSAGNVFPFIRPEGITISALAQLAGVRKQTMAQAVEQLERGGYVERRDNPERPSLAPGFPYRTWPYGDPGDACRIGRR